MDARDTTGTRRKKKKAFHFFRFCSGCSVGVCAFVVAEDGLISGLCLESTTARPGVSNVGVRVNFSQEVIVTPPTGSQGSHFPFLLSDITRFFICCWQRWEWSFYDLKKRLLTIIVVSIYAFTTRNTPGAYWLDATPGQLGRPKAQTRTG